MEALNLTIQCLRCPMTAPLDVKAARKEGSNWRPMQTARPHGWLQGPATLGDVSHGLCPQCAEDWEEVQKEFMTKRELPEDEEVRNQLMTKAPARVESLPTKAEPYIDNTIAMEIPQGPRIGSIPVRAETIVAPTIPPQAGPASQVGMAIGAMPSTATPIMHVENYGVKVKYNEVNHNLPGVRTTAVSIPQRVEAQVQPQPALQESPVRYSAGPMINPDSGSMAAPVTTTFQPAEIPHVKAENTLRPAMVPTSDAPPPAGVNISEPAPAPAFVK